MTMRLLPTACVLAVAGVAHAQGPRATVVAGPAGPTVRLDSGAESWVADLQPKSLRSSDFRVLVDDGGALTEWPAPPVTTYVGDAPGARFIASVVGGTVRAAVIAADGRSWRIEPCGDGTYRAERTDNADGPLGTCATPERPGPAIGGGGGRSIGVRVCETACDADFEFFHLNGDSVANTVADIEAVMAGVTDLFEIDVQLAFEITTVIVRTAEPDPYTATNAYTLLDEFEDWWRHNHADIHRDIAHLFTGKDLDGTVIGIGEVESACYLTAYSIVQSRYRAEWDRRWALSAHELAHNLGCHTHCDDDWTCRIMCTTLGGCNGFHSFGDWAVGRMESYMSGVSCLDPGTSDPPMTTLPLFDNFPYPNIDTSRWTAIDGPYPEFGAMNEPSPPSSLNMDSRDTIRTKAIDLAGPAKVSFWTEDRGPENNEKLRVEYFSTSLGAWRELGFIVSDGVVSDQFQFNEYALPEDARGSAFVLRLTCWGTFLDSTDDWWIDDIRIEALPCPADFNGDGQLNIFDFLAFQTAFGNEDTRADLDGSGVLNLFDFLAFQTAFGNGC